MLTPLTIFMRPLCSNRKRSAESTRLVSNLRWMALPEGAARLHTRGLRFGLRLAFVLGAGLPLLRPSPIAAISTADCSLTSTGKKPLPDLSGAYLGHPGGLYSGTKNQPPAAHLQLALTIAQEQILPRNSTGQVDLVNGKIVLISSGMSNTRMEFEVFEARAESDPAINPDLVIVNGALGSATAERWTDPTHKAWGNLMNKLANAGVTPEQVQVVWLKHANFNDLYVPFPDEMVTLQEDLRIVVQMLKTEFPNLRLAFISSRTRAYSVTGINPEPTSYESGFAMRWLIEDQIGGDPSLSLDRAPLLLWGPYLWVDGEIPRSDGLVWHCSDTNIEPPNADGTHPSETGKQKVADQLLAFFKTHPAATPWFLKGTVSGQPPQVLQAVADKTSGAAPLVVHFSASATDPDGQIAEYVWTYDDGTYAYGPNPTKSFHLAGKHTVQLTVVDNAGNSTPRTIPIQVTSEDSPSSNILTGLGSGGSGWMEILVAGPPHANEQWLRVDWSAYNDSGGETRPVFCDVDGDGTREVVLGLGSYPTAGGYLEVKDDVGSGFAHLAWLRVDFASYNAINGETFPACGDLDGDGRDEIAVGLGNGGGGWVQAFDDALGGYTPLTGTPIPGGWIRVNWSTYNTNRGEVHPAIGNIDADAREELVLGLGQTSSGWVQVLDDAAANFTPLSGTLTSGGWLQLSYGAYNLANGETWPAVGDLDGDGASELALGLGTGGGGWVQVLSGAGGGFEPVQGTPTTGGWLQVSWSTYNDAMGSTFPALGDIDGDGRDELVLGLGSYPANGGWMEIREDLVGGLASFSWARIHWMVYNMANGLVRPAVP